MDSLMGFCWHFYAKGVEKEELILQNDSIKLNFCRWQQEKLQLFSHNPSHSENLQIILINNLPIQNEIHQYQKAVDLRLKAIWIPLDIELHMFYRFK
jgi:hypothetical protein